MKKINKGIILWLLITKATAQDITLTQKIEESITLTKTNVYVTTSLEMTLKISQTKVSDMKSYDELDDSIKASIKSFSDDDPYGLSPKVLYNNILHSTGDLETLAKIFSVPVQLVRDIKADDDGSY